ncbi:hypothetical protein JK364_42120 [Streptomyces sp. 110]|uniref:DUF1453 domain-containing protein n=1 Tax=Streptomyces endocoffeicus TaxID=2898945 RepID=A0ABS1Q4R2_9ACTN|nr:hypothetical protein [Streptomyces endocoffeicus]MBL1118916.1 hypothetical protein [Streptomyces endocoffeicus]
MSFFEVVAAVAVVVALIARQLRGEALTGRRLMLLPVVLTVIGIADLSRNGRHPASIDVVCLVAGALLAAGIGAAQGATMRLERRAGVLWARMPPVGLWLWALLVVTRVGMMAVAHVVDAKVAASSATILLMLGVNRLGQALVLVPRVMSSGMAFAPERDGRTFPEQVSQRFAPPPLDDEAPGRPGGAGPAAPAGPTAPTAPTAPYTDRRQGDPLDLIRGRRQQRRARRFSDWR